jgi:hypothetical protein
MGWEAVIAEGIFSDKGSAGLRFQSRESGDSFSKCMPSHV